MKNRQYVSHRLKPGWFGYIHEFPMWSADREFAAVHWVEIGRDEDDRPIAPRNPLSTHLVKNLIKEPANV
jgi:hypothetical protein